MVFIGVSLTRLTLSSVTRCHIAGVDLAGPYSAPALPDPADESPGIRSPACTRGRVGRGPSGRVPSLSRYGQRLPLRQIRPRLQRHPLAMSGGAWTSPWPRSRFSAKARCPLPGEAVVLGAWGMGLRWWRSGNAGAVAAFGRLGVGVLRCCSRRPAGSFRCVWPGGT